MEQVDAAVQSAVRALFDAGVIEAGEVVTREGAVVQSMWLRYLEEDTFELVRYELATEASSSAGPVMVVAVDSTIYEAGPAGTDGTPEWTVSESLLQATPPWPWSIDLPSMATGGYLDTDDGQLTATVQDGENGATIWTVHDDDSDAVQQWQVAAEGHLRAYRFEHQGVGPGSAADPERDPAWQPMTGEVRFSPRQQVPDLSMPEPGEPVSRERFDVWDDLPRPD